VLKRQEPFKKHLEESLGMTVDLFTGTSYGAVIEAMRADRVDAMLVGPFSYVLAVQEAKAEAIAIYISGDQKNPTFDPNLRPAYHSVIFTKKGNGIASLNDLRGKGFNFVDPASASGHLAPKTLLIQRGINPDKDLRTVFAGSHPTSVISVWNDKAPAGATHEGNLPRLVDSGQIKWCAYPDGQVNKPRTEAEIKAVFDACPNGNIVILAQSDPIPSTPFAVRQELPASFKAEVKKTLLAIKDKPDLIAQLKYWYVDPTQEQGLQSLDQYYNSMRDIAKLLNLNLKELD
jgi:phosphonate transport system substrate-binding protein